MPEPAELKQHCPHCEGKIAYPSDMAGNVTLCPHCRREVKLSKEIKQACRACGDEISFLESMLGEEVRCPHCGKSMRLHRSGADALGQAGTSPSAESTGRQYFLSLRGKTEGPFSEAEVCSYIESGYVTANSRIQVEKDSEWFVLSQFQQFSASLTKKNAHEVTDEDEFTDEGPPDITLQIDGQQLGPYTVGQIRHALKTGAMNSSLMAHRPGMPGWQPLKKWSEFKGLGAEAVTMEESVQMTSRNPHAIDCFVSGIIMCGIIFAWGASLFTSVTSIIDPKIPLILAWVLFVGWLFARAYIIKDAATLGEGFGSIGIFEIIFKVYFIILLLVAALGLIGVLFSLGQGGEVFLFVFFFWSLDIPFLFLNWHGVRGMKRYFHEYEQSGIDLALVIMGAIPLIIINGLNILKVVFLLLARKMA